ncbi:hypothetical protein Tco_0862832 [Tanacetum coccineum]
MEESIPITSNETNVIGVFEIRGPTLHAQAWKKKFEPFSCLTKLLQPKTIAHFGITYRGMFIDVNPVSLSCYHLDLVPVIENRAYRRAKKVGFGGDGWVMLSAYRALRNIVP